MEPQNRVLSDDELNITFYPTMSRALDGKQMPRFSLALLHRSTVADFRAWLHTVLVRFDAVMPFKVSVIVEDYANALAFCKKESLPFQLRPEHILSVSLVSNYGPPTDAIEPQWHEELESDYNKTLEGISNNISGLWSAEESRATTPSAPGDVRLGEPLAGETTAAGRDVSAVTSGKQDAEDALMLLMRTPAMGRGTPKARKSHPEGGTLDDAQS